MKFYEIDLITIELLEWEFGRVFCVILIKLIASTFFSTLVQAITVIINRKTAKFRYFVKHIYLRVHWYIWLWWNGRFFIPNLGWLQIPGGGAPEIDDRQPWWENDVFFISPPRMSTLLLKTWFSFFSFKIAKKWQKMCSETLWNVRSDLKTFWEQKKQF